MRVTWTFRPSGKAVWQSLGGEGSCRAKPPRLTKKPDDENATDRTDRPRRQKEDAFLQEGEKRGLAAAAGRDREEGAYTKQKAKHGENTASGGCGNADREREDSRTTQNGP